MASGITHILLTKKLQDVMPDGKLKDIFAASTDSFQIGAIAPDLPYASIADRDFFLTIQNDLADDFHYKKTNQIPLRSLRKLKSIRSQTEERMHYRMFSFFLGYIAHVVADGIIHPFVRDKVGDYELNKAEHRSLEMQLDVLFFQEISKETGLILELNYTNIHDELKNFSKIREARFIVKIFKELIKDVFNRSYSERKIFNWINGLHRMFAVAEGDFPKIYRNLTLNTFTFHNIEDINPENATILKKPKDREINFLHVEKIDFFNDCVPQFYTRFIEIAQKAFQFVYEDGNELNENDIPMINLDTGRLIADNNLDLIPEFWK